MSVAAVEQLPTYWGPELVDQPPQLPLVINVAEMMEDQMVRQRAERFVRFVGNQAIGSQVEEAPPALRPTTLMDMIREAATGNEAARKGVAMNTHTDLVERAYKAGHVAIPIEMEETADGDIVQNNLSLEDVQANNLLYASDVPEMQPRSHAENNNVFRLKNLNRMGLLDDYWLVERSRPADNMSQKAMEESGMFTATMTVGLRATTKKDGKIVMEPAFVAGKKNPEAPRHDKETIIKMDEALGVDSTGKTAAEVIDSPLLIHKSLMPNGIIDLVTLYDWAAGGTFFGEDKPQENYLTYRDQCYEREARFGPMVQNIVAELLAESPTIITPIKAVERLNKLSGKHLVMKAVEDPTIDSRVFGPVASVNIEEARWHAQMGNAQQAQAKTAEAIKTETSKSCPTGSSKPSDVLSAPGDKPGESEGGPEGSCPEVKDGQETNCPYCKKKVRAIVKNKEKIYCSNAKCEAAAPEVKKVA